MPNLTELSTIKTELGITDTSEDTRLTRLINMADDLVQKVLGRNLFYEAGIVETVSSGGRNLIYVSRLPLASVASITFDGVEEDSDNYSIFSSETGAIINKDGWQNTGEYRSRFDASSNEAREKLYTVTYTGGYKMPGESGRDLPYDLEQAAIDIVKAAYHRDAKGEIQKESVPDVYSVEYRNDGERALGLPLSSATILDRYNTQWGFA